MDLKEEISKVAYELYVKSGCIPGRDMDNWLEAERIVMERYKSVSIETAEEAGEPTAEKPIPIKVRCKTTATSEKKKTQTKKVSTKKSSKKKES
ncbi:MAG: DUF2934 domain-containing protein [Thermodesulfovibrionales bacterium]|nr:DUF2934 domain-containing protein [Thermodesulfovibrionales bacterium]